MHPLLGWGCGKPLRDVPILPSHHSEHGVLIFSRWGQHIEAVSAVKKASLQSHLDNERSSCVLSHWDKGVVCNCSISLAHPYYYVGEGQRQQALSQLWKYYKGKETGQWRLVWWLPCICFSSMKYELKSDLSHVTILWLPIVLLSLNAFKKHVI